MTFGYLIDHMMIMIIYIDGRENLWFHSNEWIGNTFIFKFYACISFDRLVYPHTRPKDPRTSFLFACLSLCVLVITAITYIHISVMENEYRRDVFFGWGFLFEILNQKKMGIDKSNSIKYKHTNSSWPFFSRQFLRIIIHHQPGMNDFW